MYLYNIHCFWLFRIIATGHKETHIVWHKTDYVQFAWISQWNGTSIKWKSLEVLNQPMTTHLGTGTQTNINCVQMVKMTLDCFYS